MTRRLIASAVLAWVISCLSLVSANAQIASGKASHSDVALFQQAQKALKKSNYAEARSLFGNLIVTHPDSDYVPLAKLAIADSWYAEHAFKQAELEYSDFVTFFPERPEVAEAQSRIVSIHSKAD